MRLEDYDTGSTYTAHVLSSQRITAEAASEEVREIVLEVQREGFEYRPGQSIGVIVPGDAALGHHHHFRLYSVADTPSHGAGLPQVTICVRRCNYIDDYSGEEFRGIASNHLCDLRAGDAATINGPFGIPFVLDLDFIYQLQTKSFVFTPSLLTDFGCVSIYTNLIQSGPSTITGLEVYGIAFELTVGNGSLRSVSNLDTDLYVITTSDFGMVVESLDEALEEGHL